MKGERGDRRDWRDTLPAVTLGWDLALPIFAGVILGHLLDRRFGTGYTFTIGLLIVGIASGYYNVIRSVQRTNRRGRQTDSKKDNR